MKYNIILSNFFTWIINITINFLLETQQKTIEMTAMNIFVELSNKKSVFKTKEFLDHRFVPEKLPHREEKFE